MKYSASVILLPVAFAAMGGEFLYRKLRYGKNDYSVSDFVANLTNGFGFQIINFYFRFVVYGVYLHLFQHYSFFEVKNGPLAFVLVLFFVDFTHAVYHMALHKINVLWGFHVVHHSSRHMNFSVSFRNGWYQAPFYSFMDMGLALAGVPIETMAAAILTRQIYQFITHTELLPNRFPLLLDRILVSPYHHRIHHAVDVNLRDGNYGGVFSFWDDLLGTRKRTEGTIPYGIVMQTEIANPFWLNLYYYRYLAFLLKKASSFRGKLKVLFGPPSYLPPGVSFDEVKRFVDQLTKNERPLAEIPFTTQEKNYLMIHVLLTSFALGVFLQLGQNQHIPTQLALGAYTLLSFVALGALVEKASYARGLEIFRLLFALLPAYFLFIFHSPNQFWTATMAAFILFHFISISLFFLTPDFGRQMIAANEVQH